MKQINVKNLTLQFDEGHFVGTPLEQAREVVSHLNEIMQRFCEHDGNPRIMSMVDSTQVEIDGEDEDIVGNLDSAERHDLNEQLRKFTTPPPDPADLSTWPIEIEFYERGTGSPGGVFGEVFEFQNPQRKIRDGVTVDQLTAAGYTRCVDYYWKRFAPGPVVRGHPDAIIDDAPVTPKALQITLLSMVPMEVPEEELAKLTPEQRWEAANWAAAIHLHASDNYGVRVPAKPEFLSQYKECEL